MFSPWCGYNLGVMVWVQIMAPPFIGRTSKADDNNSGVGVGRGVSGGGFPQDLSRTEPHTVQSAVPRTC